MPNTDVIRKWVEALESGKYKQGKGALVDRDVDEQPAFCCLGVLCEVAVQEGVIPPASEETLFGSYGDDVERSTASLPRTVRDWAGLDEDPVTNYVEDGVAALITNVSCINLNDDLEKTFPEIAAIVRSTYLEEEN